MIKFPSNRKTLALKLFALAVVVNGFLLLLVWPASAEGERAPTRPADHVEVQIKGQLNLSFRENAAVMLLRPTGTPLGPALLLSMSETGVTILIPEKIYQQHFRALIHEEWALIPVIQGLGAQSSQPKASYEIAY